MIDWKPLSSFFQRTPIKDWDDVDVMFGDVFFDLDGKKIRRGQTIDPATGARYPAVINNERTVLGDPIPSTSWGSSLANLLTKESWDGLRHPLIRKNHSVCELCGKRRKTLDVHEIWSYEFPPEHEWAQRKDLLVLGTQKLDGLLAICHKCHLCFHLGKANVDGVLEPTLERLAGLNGWEKKTIDAYRKKLYERYELASEIGWELDLSWVRHPEGGITVRNSWKVHPEVDRLITAPNRHGGDNITALMGTKWKFQGETVWRETKQAVEQGRADFSAPVPQPAPEAKKPSSRHARPAWLGKYDDLKAYERSMMV
jgi:hypothetical protein